MLRNYCAIDFETACHNQASACAVGAARIRDGAVTETFFSLIQPPEGMAILPFFTSIHGIKMDQVRSAPTFAELWPEFKAFIGFDTLLAHNASFDRGVLGAALEHYGLPGAVPPFKCTLCLARETWPDLSNHRLDTLCDYLEIDLDHHEALSDAVACARIFMEAARV